MLKTIGIIAIIIVFAIIIGAFYVGIFNSVSIEKTSKGLYKIACLDHIGPYKGILKKIKDSKKLLDEQGIVYKEACGIYYDDPKTTPVDKLRSKGGYLVEGEPKTEILEILDIPLREVVIAKVKAHPCVAPFKVYPKVKKWLKNNELVILGPCMEIYYDNGIVEVQVPIGPFEEKVQPETQEKV